MLIRLVNMHFQANACDKFIEIFNQSAPNIRAFPGCLYVEVLRDSVDLARFYTYSHWESEAAIESYRNSELFQKTWAATKILFDERPQASTLICLHSEK